MEKWAGTREDKCEEVCDSQKCGSGSIRRERAEEAGRKCTLQGSGIEVQIGDWIEVEAEVERRASAFVWAEIEKSCSVRLREAKARGGRGNANQVIAGQCRDSL